MELHNLRAQRGGVVSALLKLVLIGLVLLVIAGGIAFYEFDRRIKADSALNEDTVIWVERGDSVSKVAEKLVSLGAFNDADTDQLLFELSARLNELAPDLKAGEYEVPAGASIEDIITLLKKGEPLLRFVTIPEGRTSRQAVAIINDAPVMENQLEEIPAEGSLLPETYSYQRGDDRSSVIKRMQDAHDRVLEELWPTRQEGLPFNTMEEAVILASIVEKETALAEERPRVAAVFVNRLKEGMRLQSDPTIIYGITGGEPLGRGIRRSELDRVTPYNTYKVDGLPPTPIANPGRASIAAVLNPAQTDDLYFVADGTGGHVFAATLNEHNANVRRWRQIEAERRRAEQE